MSGTHALKESLANDKQVCTSAALLNDPKSQNIVSTPFRCLVAVNSQLKLQCQFPSPPARECANSPATQRTKKEGLKIAAPADGTFAARHFG
jgi:hypothetical protein